MAGQTTFSTPTDTEIVTEHIFDAPRELVFKAHIDPVLTAQWWGQGGELAIDKLEPRVGGAWRFVQKDPDGNEFAFRGEYKEVDEPSRLSYTFIFEPMPDNACTETLVFSDEPDGKTKLVSTTVFKDKANRDGMLESGMEEGAIQSHDQLERLLETLK